MPQEQIRAAKEALAQADVDYEGTMAAKLLIARLLFDREGSALLQVHNCLAAVPPLVPFLQCTAADVTALLYDADVL